MTVDAKYQGLLFLSDSFYNGWEAMVDGAKVSIYRADYAFRAVFLNGGDHALTWQYTPYSFWLGLAISVLSFLVVAKRILCV